VAIPPELGLFYYERLIEFKIIIHSMISFEYPFFALSIQMLTFALIMYDSSILEFINVHIRMKVMKLLKGVGKIRKSSFNLIKASIKFPNINITKLPVFVTLCQKKRELNSLAKEK
jgi:hypothetical protein